MSSSIGIAERRESPRKAGAPHGHLEAPYTYEGTAEIHTLIVGHALTSIRAFA
jgi:hypothetical protein